MTNPHRKTKSDHRRASRATPEVAMVELKKIEFRTKLNHYDLPNRSKTAEKCQIPAYVDVGIFSYFELSIRTSN
jgi:hypothetical protein